MWRLTPGVFFDKSLPIVLSQGLSVEPRSHWCTSSSQAAWSGEHLHPPSIIYTQVNTPTIRVTQGSAHLPDVFLVLGSKLSSSCLWGSVLPTNPFPTLEAFINNQWKKRILSHKEKIMELKISQDRYKMIYVWSEIF